VRPLAPLEGGAGLAEGGAHEQLVVHGARVPPRGQPGYRVGPATGRPRYPSKPDSERMARASAELSSSP
jgi:hypothetical protein